MLGLIDLPCQVVSAPALPPWPRTSAHIVLQFVNLHLFTSSDPSQAGDLSYHSLSLLRCQEPWREEKVS